MSKARHLRTQVVRLRLVERNQAHKVVMPFRVRTNADIEVRAMALAASGLNDKEIACSLSLNHHTVRAIRRRFSMKRSVQGRPRVRPLRQKRVQIQPLTDDQRVLVERYQELSVKIARKFWRLDGQIDGRRDDYISCGYLGLVKAASRYQGEGFFPSLMKAFIRGTIRHYTTGELLSDGYAFESWRQQRLDRYAIRTHSLEINGQAGDE